MVNLEQLSRPFQYLSTLLRRLYPQREIDSSDLHTLSTLLHHLEPKFRQVLKNASRSAKDRKSVESEGSVISLPSGFSISATKEFRQLALLISDYLELNELSCCELLNAVLQIPRGGGNVVEGVMNMYHGERMSMLLCMYDVCVGSTDGNVNAGLRYVLDGFMGRVLAKSEDGSGIVEMILGMYRVLGEKAKRMESVSKESRFGVFGENVHARHVMSLEEERTMLMYVLFQISYQRQFDEKEIESLVDWLSVNESVIGVYCLMASLDFTPSEEKANSGLFGVEFLKRIGEKIGKMNKIAQLQWALYVQVARDVKGTEIDQLIGMNEEKLASMFNSCIEGDVFVWILNSFNNAQIESALVHDYIKSMLEEFVVGLIENFSRAIKKLKTMQEEDEAVKKNENRYFELFLELIAKVFQRPESGLVFWNKDGKLYQFIKMAGDTRSVNILPMYLQVIGSLAIGERCAMAVHEFFGSSANFTPLNPVLSWNHMLYTLNNCNQFLRNNLNQDLSPQDIPVLESFLIVLKNVCSYSVAARITIFENMQWKVVYLLFNLLGTRVPCSVKAMIVEAICSFSGTPEIAIQIWTYLEMAQLLPVGDSMNSIAIDFEIEMRNETYPFMKSFIKLLTMLIKQVIPEGLGAGSRIPGIVPFVEFVVMNIFLKVNYLGFRQEKEKNEIIGNCLEMFYWIMKRDKGNASEYLIGKLKSNDMIVKMVVNPLVENDDEECTLKAMNLVEIVLERYKMYEIMFLKPESVVGVVRMIKPEMSVEICRIAVKIIAWLSEASVVEQRVHRIVQVIENESVEGFIETLKMGGEVSFMIIELFLKMIEKYPNVMNIVHWAMGIKKKSEFEMMNRYFKYENCLLLNYMIEELLNQGDVRMKEKIQHFLVELTMLPNNTIILQNLFDAFIEELQGWKFDKSLDGIFLSGWFLKQIGLMIHFGSITEQLIKVKHLMELLYEGIENSLIMEFMSLFEQEENLIEENNEYEGFKMMNDRGCLIYDIKSIHENLVENNVNGSEVSIILNQVLIYNQMIEKQKGNLLLLNNFCLLVNIISLHGLNRGEINDCLMFLVKNRKNSYFDISIEGVSAIVNNIVKEQTDSIDVDGRGGRDSIDYTQPTFTNVSLGYSSTCTSTFVWLLNGLNTSRKKIILYSTLNQLMELKLDYNKIMNELINNFDKIISDCLESIPVVKCLCLNFLIKIMEKFPNELIDKIFNLMSIRNYFSLLIKNSQNEKNIQVFEIKLNFFLSLSNYLIGSEKLIEFGILNLFEISKNYNLEISYFEIILMISISTKKIHSNLLKLILENKNYLIEIKSLNNLKLIKIISNILIVLRNSNLIEVPKSFDEIILNNLSFCLTEKNILPINQEEIESSLLIRPHITGMPSRNEFENDLLKTKLEIVFNSLFYLNISPFSFNPSFDSNDFNSNNFNLKLLLDSISFLYHWEISFKQDLSFIDSKLNNPQSISIEDSKLLIQSNDFNINKSISILFTLKQNTISTIDNIACK
ncbi:hypothetical protein ROZALSC1DRAFT_30269 [Rozella allomycis CSF55]|uniref:Nucleoporin Nup186/Nup192/Nup205 domain-containing protein n=1 Tax=Rozella allomycis (strain CSF55) TaxID=988480 RepID=A0A075AXK1_ROZAC|nr:Nucleoporin Nup186/Nup192/Nup205 domain-containing protein [Rozella allomycis CSF55]RKP17982.1 hypothetical protein ROZALSC1DRAFT_30269 [Rozella allomycis CSF55]|eukprot:EPZ33269.1 Nucleoporin Nup186/Nup192/Nup205 domain-containing protein [Rozella allomycis CSF55]